jgi:HEAT repeat protein
VDAALEVLQVRTAWTRSLVPQLVELVATELSRKRSRVLGLAMRVLAKAQDKAALAALVALHGKRFNVRPYRAQWLEALASFRAPSAKRVLAAYADASDPQERITATVGLVRNGNRAALASLRRAFEDSDRAVAQEAARQAHFLLKTSFAFNEQQLARLVKWWDAHPEEVQRRFLALARA